MARMCKYGESKTTQIMMATVPHVTSGLGLRKFQADGFLLTRVYMNTGMYSCLVNGRCNLLFIMQHLNTFLNACIENTDHIKTVLNIYNNIICVPHLLKKSS